MKNFYGGRPFTTWGLEACDACHLVLHFKGDEVRVAAICYRCCSHHAF